MQTLVTDALSHCAVPIYIHWTRGEYGGASWPVSGIYYQYEESTAEGVESETRSHVGKWHDAGKKFIAAEFSDSLSPSQARACGDAAISAGADGSACGATGGKR